MKSLKKFNFTATEIEKFKDIAIQKVYQPEELIIKEGERDRSLLIITKGKVKVVVHRDNQPKTVATLPAESLIGELNFTIPLHRSADVCAMEKTEVLVFNYRDLCELLKSDNNISTKFFLGINHLLIERIHSML